MPAEGGKCSLCLRGRSATVGHLACGTAGARWADGTGSALIPDPLVVIDGGTIVAVDSGGPAPAGADIVDLGGAALLPGLVDTHVHLAFDASADPVGELARRDDSQAMEAMTRAGQAALRGGVTTVRDLGDRGYLSLGLRGRPACRHCRGRAADHHAGRALPLPGRGGRADRGGRPGRGTRARRHGADVIKIMASGGT